jgi:uncharacterized protein YqeY
MSTDIRVILSDALKDAMRSKSATRLGTLRLINAAIKDQDIALRVENKEAGAAEVLVILAKMVKQRHESAKAYREGGRLELADQENFEITVIEEFLPRQLTKKETEKAIEKAISISNATGIRDVGKVIAMLKRDYAGQMDFGSVGPSVKNKLS